jgi:hypothetical protein
MTSRTSDISMQILKCFPAFLALLALLSTARVALAQELSAEQVGIDSAGHTFKSKIYMGHGKVRVEPIESASPGAADPDNGIMLLDLVAGTSVVLDTKRKTYIEQSPAMARRSVQFFRPADNTPCAKNPNSPGTSTCKKIGTEMVNGRNTEKWELIATMTTQTITAHVWLDAKWHFVVKGEGPGLTGGLENIKEGPQPASLFEIPPGYQKMTMQDRFKKN